MTSNTPNLAAIEKIDVFRSVLQQLERLIDDGNLRPGDRLPSDRELASMLGVSRPVVRQASKVLEGLGRVTSRQGSGTYVTDPASSAAVHLTRGLSLDQSLLSDLLPARRAIEVEILKSAFQHRTPEHVAELQKTVSDPRASGHDASDGGTSPGLDLSFERNLGKMCGNEVLMRLQSVLHDAWLKTELAVGLAPADQIALHNEHRQILEAFLAGDLPEAVRLLEDHLTFGT